MEILYDLENKKLLNSPYSIEEVLEKNKNSTVSLVCGANTENLENKIQEFKQTYGDNINIELVAKDEREYIYEESEIDKYLDIFDICKNQNIKMNIQLNGATSEFVNFVVARDQIEDFATKLNGIRVNQDGKQVPLSPIEKFFVVYKFVSNRVYNESEDFGDMDMRNWMGVLSGDKVICSGFASLLKCVCDRVFDKSELECFNQGCEVYDKQTGEFIGAHANNLIKINDEKYNIRGLYASDACWGSLSELNNMLGEYTYTLNPITSYGKNTKYKFRFPKNYIFYENVNGVDLARHKDHDQSVEKIMKSLDVPEILLQDKNDILDKRKQKAYKEIGENNKKFREESKKKREIFLQHLKKFVDVKTANNLEQVMEIKVPTFFPENLKKDYPILEKFENVFSSLNVNNLDKQIQSLKDFENFYNNNKQIFEELETQPNVQLRKLSSIVMSDAMKLRASGKDTGTSYSEVDKQIEKEVEQEFISAKETFNSKKDFIFAEELPKVAIRNGIAAVAVFEGLTTREEINNYVDAEMQYLKATNSECFLDK